MSSKSVLILLSHGTEEIEFATVYDVCVRAGLSPKSVFVGSSSQSAEDPHGVSSSTPEAPYAATLSRGLKVLPDLKLPDLAGGKKAFEFDAVVIPGGAEGAKTISENGDVQSLIAKYYADGKVVAAICAGVLAVKTSGIAKDSKLTSHPSVKDELSKDYRYSEDRIVISDNLITSRGPGTSLLFALSLVEKLLGPEKREEISGPMILSDKL
ncbi:DJ-1 [Microstroma glucosiphilum]|uniref:D-lactate dehydratase n=1 Tax=Pseudomicrostroma glucosiphilum TaxID=1684307 RepID=A0A316UHW2_9BASI|nr:DJ-1 [Pseudomicrostroma glucosiphilum]PWN23523.1 DJ-1 [Pseudomicrostroma glucosiphilum]